MFRFILISILAGFVLTGCGEEESSSQSAVDRDVTQSPTKLGKPYVLFYQGAAVAERIEGGQEALDASLLAWFDLMTDELTESQVAWPVGGMLVLLFDDEGNKKAWFYAGEDVKSQAEFARQVDIGLMTADQAKLMTTQGVVGVSVGFQTVDSSGVLPAKPPIPHAWDEVIAKNKKIGASQLFDLLMDGEA